MYIRETNLNLNCQDFSLDRNNSLSLNTNIHANQCNVYALPSSLWSSQSSLQNTFQQECFWPKNSGD